MALVSDVQQGFDPQQEYYSIAWEFDRCCLLRTLVSYNGKSTKEEGAGLFPDLAAEMPEISADGLTWTFTLQPGLRYAPPLDDVEITAGDFVRAMERTADPRANVGGYSFYYSVIEGFDEFADGKAGSISGIEAVDDLTLNITVTESTGDLGRNHPAEPVRPEGPARVGRRSRPELRPVHSGERAVHVRGLRGPGLLGARRRAGPGVRIQAWTVDRARAEPLVGPGDRSAQACVPRSHRDLDRWHLGRPRAAGRVR